MAEENIRNNTSTNTNSCESTENMQMDMFSDTWGFSLEELYKIAVTFYRGLLIYFEVCSALDLYFR